MQHRHGIIALSILVGLSLLLFAPVVEGRETVQWLRGSKDFGKATERAETEKKLLLLDFFHPH